MTEFISFLLILPFVVIGFAVYILKNFVDARALRNYSPEIFLKKNLLRWVLGFVYCLIGAYLWVRIPNIDGMANDVFGIIAGYSGGSIGKATLKTGMNLLKFKR